MTLDRRTRALQLALAVWVAVVIVIAGALPAFEASVARLCGAP